MFCAQSTWVLGVNFINLHRKISIWVEGKIAHEKRSSLGGRICLEIKSITCHQVPFTKQFFLSIMYFIPCTYSMINKVINIHNLW